MNNFEFYNPVKIVFGAGEVKRIGEISAEFGKKALIVTYQDTQYFGNLIENIENSLKDNGVESVIAKIATANPKISEVKVGIQIGKTNNVDMVIGLGGGSAMDSAKIVSAGLVYPL
jgi:Alcohol dehydrogenase, class IV